MNPKSHASFIASLAAFYVEDGALLEEEKDQFITLLQALVVGDIKTILELAAPYRDTPEDGIVLLSLLAEAVGALLNNYSSHYEPLKGHLQFHFVSKPGVDRPFSHFTGEVQHSLLIDISGGQADGYRRFQDDSLRSALHRQSGRAEPSEAAAHLVRVLDDAIARCKARVNFEFSSIHLSRPRQSDWRSVVQFYKERRKVALEVEARKKHWGYRLWRWWHHERLFRYGL